MSKLRLTIAWHENYGCKWVKQVGIETPLGEKPGIWLIGMNQACISIEFSVFFIAKMHDSQYFLVILY